MGVSIFDFSLALPDVGKFVLFSEDFFEFGIYLVQVDALGKNAGIWAKEDIMGNILEVI